MKFGIMNLYGVHISRKFPVSFMSSKNQSSDKPNHNNEIWILKLKWLTISPFSEYTFLYSPSLDQLQHKQPISVNAERGILTIKNCSDNIASAGFDVLKSPLPS